MINTIFFDNLALVYFFGPPCTSYILCSMFSSKTATCLSTASIAADKILYHQDWRKYGWFESV